MCRYLTTLDARHIVHTLHLYMDTDNAPASAIGDTIIKIAEEASAELLVVASHNKIASWEELFVGSVADYCFNNCKRPLAIVRNYSVLAPVSPVTHWGPVASEQQ
jgi:nucleotide-binding universal stress UspA family protein